MLETEQSENLRQRETVSSNTQRCKKRERRKEKGERGSEEGKVTRLRLENKSTVDQKKQKKLDEEDILDRETLQ